MFGERGDAGRSWRTILLKAPRFGYARPSTVAEALELLAKYRDEARALAGGQSLGVMLNLRVAAPRVIVDINRISALAGISVTSSHVRIGALTRHAAVEHAPEIAALLPLVAQAMPHVGHPAIRTRGTFGGSCALADPSAELPACALALDATFIIAGRQGERRLSAQDFFRGTYTTALHSDELLIATEIPKLRDGYASTFREFSRRQGDFAMAGVAIHGSIADQHFADLRVVLFGVHDRPTRALQIERELENRPTAAGSIRQALAALDADLKPIGDIHATAAAKGHLARVLTARALAKLGNLDERAVALRLPVTA
jgi:carbon-monoxide dehydrogenase medium subunit